jgi:ParB family transcriptional regulator, chromosome partitioning protein
MTPDTNPRKALGRGLAALIPSAAPSAATSAAQKTVPIERVRPNREQPRKYFDEQALAELADSIREHGVLQPIIVKRAGEEYSIVAGERRWRAAALAGLHEVPAIIKDLTPVETLEVALIENLQRQDLDPLEEAAAYGRLMKEHGLTQDHLANRLGKSRAAVANTIRLLKLPEALLNMLADGRLTAGHARALMTVRDDDLMVKLAHDTLERALSVRELERAARLAKHHATDKKTQKVQKTPAEITVEERLQRRLKTKVRLHHRKGKGRIEIFFHSLDELDQLLDTIAP